MDEMDVRRKRPPLFEVLLELQEPILVFVPSLEINDNNGFYRLVEGLIYDIMSMATLIPRVNTQSDHHDYKVCFKI